MAKQIKCEAVDLSDEQRANLATLSAYLWSLPKNYKDFDMGVFTHDRISSPHKVACGTAACAAGHGPKAGIPGLASEDWGMYSRRVFVPPGYAWDWCFSGCWNDVDNTVHGAAARIDYLLEHGLPHNAFEQELGDEPLCYTKTKAQVV